MFGLFCQGCCVHLPIFEWLNRWICHFFSKIAEAIPRRERISFLLPFLFSSFVARGTFFQLIYSRLPACDKIGKNSDHGSSPKAEPREGGKWKRRRRHSSSSSEAEKHPIDHRGEARWKKWVSLVNSLSRISKMFLPSISFTISLQIIDFF